MILLSKRVIAELRTAAEQEPLVAYARIRDQAALLDKARDAIIVRGIDHWILYWNKSAQRLYGWTANQELGVPIEYLIKAAVPA
jgi:PAS domain-containing protein